MAGTRSLSVGSQRDAFRRLCIFCLFVALNLHLEYFREMFDDPLFDFEQIDFAAQNFFHRRHWFAFTSDNQIEVTQIGVHVQRKAVRRHPTGDVHPDRRNFPAR